MSYESSVSFMRLVDAIADVVQRHGRHDFRPDSTGHSSRLATLCGLTVRFQGTAVRRLTTHDLDLHCNPSESGSLDFHHGSASHLETWHRKIVQLDHFFGPESVPVPALAQAA